MDGKAEEKRGGAMSWTLGGQKQRGTQDHASGRRFKDITLARRSRDTAGLKGVTLRCTL